MKIVRFKSAAAELPERIELGDGIIKFVNVRSTQRIDVRPGLTELVATGIRLDFNPNLEQVTVVNLLGDSMECSNNSELFVKITNTSRNNIQIYYGQPIADILVRKVVKLSSAIMEVEPCVTE